MSNSIVVATACDQYYFPLAKGLYLSLLKYDLPKNVTLAFLDLGCDAQSLSWLKGHGIRVEALPGSVLGDFAAERYGYHRAQICRPYLPELFPYGDVLAWLDCDTWVQDPKSFLTLLREPLKRTDRFFASLELHVGYVFDGFDLNARISEMYSYYEPVYGIDVADKLSRLPTINSGVILANRECSIWAAWRGEVDRIFGEEMANLHPNVLHFSEQISLNKVLRDTNLLEPFDPKFNFLCLWSPPERSADGAVRLNFPPYEKVAVIHLAGGWRHFGDVYNKKKLLFDDGKYLSEIEKRVFLSDVEDSDKFR